MGYELRDWRFSKHGTSWVAKGSDSTLNFVNDVALIGAADADAIRQNIQRHVSARLAREEAVAFSAIPVDVG